MFLPALKLSTRQCPPDGGRTLSRIASINSASLAEGVAVLAEGEEVLAMHKFIPPYRGLNAKPWFHPHIGSYWSMVLGGERPSALNSPQKHPGHAENQLN
jgi:hypothetical protein